MDYDRYHALQEQLITTVRTDTVVIKHKEIWTPAWAFQIDSPSGDLPERYPDVERFYFHELGYDNVRMVGVHTHCLYTEPTDPAGLRWAPTDDGSLRFESALGHLVYSRPHPVTPCGDDTRATLERIAKPVSGRPGCYWVLENGCRYVLNATGDDFVVEYKPPRPDLAVYPIYGYEDTLINTRGGIITLATRHLRNAHLPT